MSDITNPSLKFKVEVFYKLRTWDSFSSSYVWDADWTQIPESLVVSIGPITKNLDSEQLNEFKVSNVDLTILNTDGSWNPHGGSIFTGAEPYWTKFKIVSGYYEDWAYDIYDRYYYLGMYDMFVGVAVGYTSEAGAKTVRFNIQGIESILMNANAEDVSLTVSNETPTGTVNGSNKDFVTLNPGVGIIDSVTVASVSKYVGKDFDVSQLNEPTLGAKITFQTAPTTGQAVRVWYKYWKQAQKIEDLITDLLTVANLHSGASVQKVTFPGGVGDSFIFDTQADWSAGSGSDSDITRVPGSVRINLDVSSNYELLDDFSDGNFTSNPTWTVRAGSHGSGWQIVSNKLQGDMFTVGSVIDTPGGGRTIGTWICDSSFISGNNGTGFSFCFSGDGTYNYGPNSVMRSHVGDRVEYYDKYSGSGAHVRLVLDNVIVAEKDVAWNNPTIKVIRYGSGLVNVYLNGALELSGQEQNWQTSNLIGFGGLDYSYDGLWQFDNIYRPKSTITSTWTSQTLDLTPDVISFGTMVVDKYAGQGTITISTRTSADGSNWGSWSAITSEGGVGSTPLRYAQIKIYMTHPTSSSAEPNVSYIKMNYNKLTTNITMANFTGKTCYEAIQSLGAFANYEWGFTESETFFFREKDVSSTVDLALNDNDYLISFECTNAGHDQTYSEVRATFGNYDVVIKDPGSETGPLKRYGKKRLTVDGGDILIPPDTNVATGIASGLYESVKNARRTFTAKVKLMQWIKLADTVSVTWGINGNEYNGLLCKIIGIRHDFQSVTTSLDLQELLT